MLLELTYWQSVVQNAIGCTIGSFLAIGVSVLIYWFTIRKSVESAKVAIFLEEQNRIKAFSLMVSDAKYVVEKQLKHIDSYIELLKEHPVNFPKITLVPIGKIKRIVDTITVEKTGFAYMRHFSNQDAATEFTQMLDYFDYFFSEFSALADFVKTATLNHIDRANQYSELLDVLNKSIVENLSSLRQEPSGVMDIRQGLSGVMNRIVEIRSNFMRARRGADDIEIAKKFLVLPLLRYLETLGGELISESEFCRGWYYTSSQLIEYYNRLPDGYSKFRDEMIGVRQNVEENLMKLELSSARLLGSELAKS